MNVVSTNQEDDIAILEADRYGHPKQAYLRRLSIPANHNWGLAPQADRFGHIKEIAMSTPPPALGLQEKTEVPEPCALWLP